MYTEQQVNKLIRDAFLKGEQWGITHSTWFIPTQKQTEEQIQKILCKPLQNH